VGATRLTASPDPWFEKDASVETDSSKHFFFFSARNRQTLHNHPQKSNRTEWKKSAFVTDIPVLGSRRVARAG
jgi:hypothetical protein